MITTLARSLETRVCNLVHYPLNANMYFNARTLELLDHLRTVLAPETYLLFTVYNHLEMDLGVSGKLKVAESALQAISREVVEEIGCRVVADHLIEDVRDMDHAVPSNVLSYSGSPVTHFYHTSLSNLANVSKKFIRRWDRQYVHARDTYKRFTLIVSFRGSTHELRNHMLHLSKYEFSRHRPLSEQALTGYCMIPLGLVHQYIRET